MKIPPPPPTPPRIAPPPKNAHDANKTNTKRTEGGANAQSAADGSAFAEATAGRDFASVLKEVSRPAEREASDEGNASDDKRESRSTDGTERERETERREDFREGNGERGGGGHMSGRGTGVREANVIGESTNARAILHIADLERILAAVRTQTLPGGRREVTLELQRSVLEGLRVKLSTDEGGRVTAEFIASTERVRAQLDARTADLADLLRSRGVDLASLKTTLGADASGQHHNAPDGGQQPAPRAAISDRRAPLDGAVDAADAEAVAVAQERATSDSDSTYRA